MLYKTCHNVLTKKKKACVRSLCPHHQLVDGLLQPEADESSQGVIEDQQHDGTDKVVPLTPRVHSELPRAGAVALDNGGDAKHTEKRQKGL